MYLSDDAKTEISYFRKLNGHFTIHAGNNTSSIAEANDKIVFMAMCASLAIDFSEDAFFESFFITDKEITGKEEMQIDAYAFIETESSNEKHLHLFQYKLHTSNNKSISPLELMNFATLMNNTFVHPEFKENPLDNMINPVFREINEKKELFLKKRGRKIAVHCHFINNSQGITRSNEGQIQDVLGRFDYDKQHHNFKVQVYGLKDIIDLAVDGKIKVESENIDFLIDGPNAYRFEDNSNTKGLGLPKKVFVGMCNINEFIRLQNKYHHNQLYSKNIRLYLGDRASVNKDIINTITSNESIWFPYMNNGISIICDEFHFSTPSNTNRTISIELKNLQIINGCQTVNALYSAKYNTQTKDDFRASNILVRIYQIDPNQSDFKLNVIKATNNQNAVKTYSLLANDPIQVKIAEVMKRLDYLYDRKGEAKQDKTEKVISMPNAALAYRAVFWYAGQELRSRIGHSRVFQTKEYEKIYKIEALDDPLKLYKICAKLLVSSIILDKIRDLIKMKSNEIILQLPIFNKSTYYLGGLFYAMYKSNVDSYITDIIELLQEDNLLKTTNTPIPLKVTSLVEEHFLTIVEKFTQFYQNLDIEDKADIDNLIKSKSFGIKFRNLIGNQDVTLLDDDDNEDE